MSSAIDHTDIPRLVSPLRQPARYSEVINAIARTTKMMILCGDGALKGTGLQPLDEPLFAQPGSEARRSLRSLIKECSTAHVRPEDLPAASLAALNRAMTERRIAARASVPNSFLDFLVRLFEEGRLVSCLTSGFDGVEAKGRPDLAEKIVRLYGDNRVLRCCAQRCQGVAEDDAMQLDDIMMSEGVMICQSCNQRHTKTSKSRRVGNNATRTLRAAVQDHLGADLTLGQGYTNLLEAATECQLFLILGASLKEADLLELTREIASTVHEKYGAVVYIAAEPLQGRHTYEHIDLHLQSEVQEAIARVSEEMNMLHGQVDGLNADEDEDSENDLWYDMVNNELPGQQLAEESPYLGLSCIHCSCSIPEYLVQCSNCSSHFCHRQTPHEETTTHMTPARNDPNQEATAEGTDTFRNEEACIAFNVYATGVQPLPLENAEQDFVCPYCWDHKSQGLYPHGVRPVPRITPEQPDRPRPRLAMLVFYVNQFWPQTKHLCTMVAGLWRSMGWQCIIEPVKLEHLAENHGAFDDLRWEPGSYEMMFVYITHGLSGDQGIQVGHTEGVRPVQLFERTLPIAARGALEGARSRRAFLVCCGYPFHHPEFVTELREWVNRDGAVDSVVGCLNAKLSPAYMVNLLARLSTKLVNQDKYACPAMFQMWMSDSIACTHCDLLCLAPGREPELWLYAPFQTRPLGKPLPNLLSVCSCPRPRHDLDHRSGGQRARKLWKVTHDGKPGSDLRDVKVTAMCQICRQSWVLPVEHLDGKLHRVDGMYAVIVPYFRRANTE